MQPTVTAKQKAVIDDRVRKALKAYFNEGQSVRGLAPVIGVERPNVYTILNGSRRLTMAQLILLLNRWIDEGKDIEQVIKGFIGEGEQCVLSDSSSQLLQRQSLESYLTKAFKPKRR
jgi:DNA-binding protein Fis